MASDAGREKNIFFPDDSNCPVRDVVTQLTSKWAMLILFALIDDHQRFSELQRRIENISRRMLTVNLRRLERDGYIKREAFAEVPPRVVYSLTSTGREVVKLLTDLVKWTKNNHENIRDSREVFDSKMK